CSAGLRFLRSLLPGRWACPSAGVPAGPALAATGVATRRRQWRGAGLFPASGGLWFSERDGLVRRGRGVQQGARLMEERLILRRESDRFLLSLQFFTRIPIPASVPYSEEGLDHAV